MGAKARAIGLDGATAPMAMIDLGTIEVELTAGTPRLVAIENRRQQPWT